MSSSRDGSGGTVASESCSGVSFDGGGVESEGEVEVEGEGADVSGCEGVRVESRDIVSEFVG